MLTRLSKNVVCIKDIPSNLIEEAFFILKANSEANDLKNEKKREEIIMTEINDMMDECTKNITIERERQKKREIELRNKLMKVRMKTLIVATAFVAACLVIAAIYL